MGFVIFGTKQLPINTQTVVIDCPICKSFQECDILVSSEYVHFYWIPLVPVDKNAFSICRKCGQNRSFAFSQEFIIKNSIEAKAFRHPLFTYTGLLAIITITGLMILSSFI